MRPPKVFLIHLRRPDKSVPDETRADPFYEHGSFGCTGCHHRNVMHPRHAEDLQGARLGFAQGGSHGFRLVYLTPPVSVKVWPDRCEARWHPSDMPFKYEAAPVLVCNSEDSDFPLIWKFADDTDRTTVEGGFSSRFRSRVDPLEVKVAAEVVRVYERARRHASRSAIAANYIEALPYPPAKQDHHRLATLQNLRQELSGESVDGGQLLQLKVSGVTRYVRSRCRQSDQHHTRGKRP
jgi:hypothetical protein